MSNFIIRQQGPSSVVVDNMWEIRVGAGVLLLGALAGWLGEVLVGIHHPGTNHDVWQTPGGRRTGITR
jgi:hypothetical protein